MKKSGSRMGRCGIAYGTVIDAGRAAELSNWRLRMQVLAGLLVMGAIVTMMAACGDNGGLANVTPTPTPRGARSIWVVDNGNNRSLEYLAPINVNGQLAATVLGEPNFAQTICEAGGVPTADCQSNPFASGAVDHLGDFWVTDLGNNRVLKYVPPFTNGEAAVLVLGQPNFGSKTPGSGQNQFNQPIYVAFDRNGNLWVSDIQNNRVVEFVPPFSDDMNASVVIGQPSFAATTCVGGVAHPGTATASGLCAPWGIGFDKFNDMFIADNGNSRILEFKPPFSNGMSASFVIGQPNFTSNAAPISPTANLVGPFGIAVDANDNVWAADVNYQRVIEFPPPASNGESAIRVLGEPDFVTDNAICPPNPPTASLICEAFDVKVDAAGNVYAVDNDNSRMLVWDAPITNNGQAANFVVGQSSFTTSTGAAGDGGLHFPAGIALGGTLQP